MDGIQFCNQINEVYHEVVYWQRNVFPVLSGFSGKFFVSELSGLFQAYADGSALESMAITAVIVAPHPLLQKNT